MSIETAPQPAVTATPANEYLKGPSATILADSVSPEGVRLTSFELVMNRWVLAEFNTHKIIYRSAASSRAVPVRKVIEQIRSHPAWPVRWLSEQSGMQGGDGLSEEDVALIRRHWERHIEDSLKVAHELRDLGLHKSLTNRLLEPFQYVKVVTTGVAWQNFFGLRDHPDAQPELQAVAHLMREAYDNHEPTALKPGEWHLPYITVRDEREVADHNNDQVSASLAEVGIERTLARVSAARCARTSFLTNPVVGSDGQVVEAAALDPIKDLSLVDRLIGSAPRHWSPFEHQATPWPENRQSGSVPFTLPDGRHFQTPTAHLPRVGALVGWRSQRTETETIMGEVTFR